MIFDCDAPSDIQDVITEMTKSENEYILDYSNLLFETWLVMHFKEINEAGKIYQHDIKDMNPSVSIHNLIERLLDEIVYLCR